MTTDGNGFVVTGVDTDPEKPSLFFVGGSLVESSFSHPQDRFVSKVAKSVDWNVFNAGYSGTTLLQSCVMIMVKLPMLAKAGDTIMLFVSQSDANAARSQGGYWTNNSTYSPIKPPAEQAPGIEFSFKHTETLLDTISVFLKGMGINLVVASSPYRRIDWSTDKWIRGHYGTLESFKKAQELRRGLNQTAKAHSVVSGIDFLDLASEIDGDPGLFYDEQHFNKAGHIRAAEAISEFLVANGVPSRETVSTSQPVVPVPAQDTGSFQVI
ncbi:SGNH/GDSL hydrolase family protein [Corynebacterium incognita]|uniref:SGNH/GDSL hydrolase family protein n=1 Tax=Corynebacterium incognita TaxID=2754725 RepID=A0A7G7CRM9_9CORY|nr:SGNH/GDSL hydrolase family protein [Corynebacterium incognita]QNE90245.1 SGNH/GDSL hydrolase family protein [Corynebacterium incognita]